MSQTLHRLLTLVSGRELQPDAHVPTRWEVDDYVIGHDLSRGLPYPGIPVYRDADGRKLPLRLFMDVDNGWLWSSVATTGHPWAVHQQVLDSFGNDLDRLIPPAIRAHEPNHRSFSGGPHQYLLIRHPLTPQRAALMRALLAEDAPHAAEYPVPAEAAEEFRAAGWSPAQATEAAAGWRITTAADAAVFTAHSPRYWWDARWPLSGTVPAIDLWGGNNSPAMPFDELPPPAMTAQDAAAILNAGVRHDVTAAYVKAGITDPARIIDARPPSIPDTATRILIPTSGSSGHYWHGVEPSGPSTFLDGSPASWLRDTTTEDGPTLLHAHVDTPNGQGWLIWSDGLLTEGHLLRPDGIPRGPEGKAWEQQFLRAGWETTAPLVRRVLRARNRDTLGPVWMAWENATGLDSVEEEQTARTAPVGMRGSRVAEIRLVSTLTRHTVHLPTGEEHLWEAREEIKPDEDSYTPPSAHRHRWLYTSEEEARAQYERCAHTDPVVATVGELAGLLNVSRSAIAQALSRAEGNRERGRPHTLWRPGPAHIYAVRSFTDWWTSRPGRGPGRGHRRT